MSKSPTDPPIVYEPGPHRAVGTDGRALSFRDACHAHPFIVDGIYRVLDFAGLNPNDVMRLQASYALDMAVWRVMVVKRNTEGHAYADEHGEIATTIRVVQLPRMGIE